MVTRWHMVCSFRDACCSVLLKRTRAAISLGKGGLFPLLCQGPLEHSAWCPVKCRFPHLIGRHPDSGQPFISSGTFPFVLSSSSSCSVKKFTHTDMLIIRTQLKTWGFWKASPGQLSSMFCKLSPPWNPKGFSTQGTRALAGSPPWVAAWKRTASGCVWDQS